MPLFRPLIKPWPLPSIGAANTERAVLDWKTRLAEKSFERAKDIAAFANHLGGTLLIGACEVKLKADKALEGWGGDAYVYPVRVATRTTLQKLCEPFEHRDGFR